MLNNKSKKQHNEILSKKAINLMLNRTKGSAFENKLAELWMLARNWQREGLEDAFPEFFFEEA